MLEGLREGVGARGAAVLVEGEPGAGKTALVDELERRAADDGMRVLRAAGTPAESTIPYSGLHALLHPLRERIPGLPRPQREALELVFGVAAGEAPTAFLAGLGALTLLSDAARDGGLLVIGEDVHWLDPVSRSALFMLARRIGSDPVLVALTSRSGEAVAAAEGLQHLLLAPLPFIDANALLDARSDPPRGAERRALLELADGNPLALVELSGADIAGSERLDLVPLGGRLERAFAGRLSELSEPARVVALVCAIGGGESAEETLAVAAGVLGRPAEAEWLDAALDAGLLERFAHGIRFRHPLMRSAVTSASAPAERRRVLRALVASLADDPARTLWWRAELAVGADAGLAAELERLAALSLAADDADQAMRAFRRAASLSADAEDRVGLLLRAAEAAARAGAHWLAEELLAGVSAQSADAAVLARASWQRELLPTEGSALAHGDLGPALAAIHGMREAGEPDRALDALVFLASIVWDHSTDADPGRPLVETVRALDLDADDPRMLFLAALTEPFARGDEVIARILRRSGDDPDDGERAWYLGYALNLCGEIETAWVLLRRAVDALRRQGPPRSCRTPSWGCRGSATSAAASPSRAPTPRSARRSPPSSATPASRPPRAPRSPGTTRSTGRRPTPSRSPAARRSASGRSTPATSARPSRSPRAWPRSSTAGRTRRSRPCSGSPTRTTPPATSCSASSRSRRSQRRRCGAASPASPRPSCGGLRRSTGAGTRPSSRPRSASRAPSSSTTTASRRRPTRSTARRWRSRSPRLGRGSCSANGCAGRGGWSRHGVSCTPRSRPSTPSRRRGGPSGAERSCGRRGSASPARRRRAGTCSPRRSSAWPSSPCRGSATARSPNGSSSRRARSVRTSTRRSASSA